MLRSQVAVKKGSLVGKLRTCRKCEKQCEDFGTTFEQLLFILGDTFEQATI